MTKLHAAYDISDIIPGTELQGTANADRPLSAFIAAVASYLRGNPLRGALTGASYDEITAVTTSVLRASDVPVERAKLWVAGVNGRRLVPTVVGLTDKTLSEYQRAGIAYMTVAGGIMAFRMGLGKTLTATCAAMAYVDQGHASNSRCWIVCPINAMGAWKPYMPDLFARFAEVRILSVDSAHKWDSAANDGGVLIMDEAHMLGDMNSRRTIHMHKLRAKFDVGLVLTGTLLHAGIEKCLSMLDIAIPGATGFSNRYACGERFACLEKKKLGTRSVTAITKPDGAHREAFLEYLSRYTVSLDKNHPDVRASAEIPDQALTMVRVGEPWPKIEDLGAAIIRMELADGGDIPHASAVMHALMGDGFEAKWSGLLALVEKHGEHEPWVIFAHYRETLDKAAEKLKDMGVAFVRVDGSSTIKERQEAQRMFQAGEVQVFLGQIHAAGVAIDLFASHLSVTLDTSWSAIDYDQALARTCRRGQTKTCLHWDLVANDLQVAVINRLRDAADFNAECAEYQIIKNLLPKKGPSHV